MLSKAKVKYIKSLQIKKFRNTYQEFLVEGAKSVLELLNSDFRISSLYLTKDFIEKHHSALRHKALQYEEVSASDLENAGSFATNNAALAIVKMKENKPLFISGNEYVLMLDEVKDPGNLGTIIRIADWYGITKIICSDDTADVYNPKVISSTMGSFTRVNLYYCELKTYLEKVKNEKVYGAAFGGKNIHKTGFAPRGYVIMGNESSGIREDLFPLIHEKISIPGRGEAESLNVSVATAIILDNIFKAY
ncbi:MAG: RNA methyltransferase [Cytophagaceae bacterium]|nr:RNA methyltransferase [Cytophagaceae bacterium]